MERVQTGQQYSDKERHRAETIISPQKFEKGLVIDLCLGIDYVHDLWSEWHYPQNATL